MRNGLAQLRVFKELDVGDVAYVLGVSYGTVLSWERYGGAVAQQVKSAGVGRVLWRYGLRYLSIEEAII